MVFDVDGDIEVQVPERGESNTDRIVLILPGAELTSSLDRSFDDPLLRRLRARQRRDAVEIELDLHRAGVVHPFTLPPNDSGRGHRVVVDLAAQLSQEEQENRAARHAARIEAVRQSGDFVVAIDPGHGGEDPGTVWGESLREKEVALQVAQRLQRTLDATPGVRGILTRKADYFVPLGRRQRIAKEFGASVFVSIHVNAALAPTARGAEVFFLSLQDAVDRAARELVDRENAADLVGGVPPDQIHEPIVDILMGMTRNKTMRESERLADILLQRLGQVQNTATRGIKQGPLAVLKNIEKPSVLVELGFMTNAGDRKLLASSRMQETYARQLGAGITQYLGA